ncbi:MAG: radical SAM protein, partial [Myxococcales bacterium]|nr:radical SAM protein [Myxococcales bacterium]
MTESPLRASFYTLGCRLNQAETSLISNGFRQRGYDVVDFGEIADVCVINSCTVTEQADAKCRHLVRQVLRRNPETYVAIVGCYAQTGFQVLEQIEGLDLIVGNAEKMRVVDYIGDEPLKTAEPRVVRPRIPRQAFTVEPAEGRADTTRANLKIQDGCDFMCSFCVIPMARGRARSRDFADLRREAEGLIAAGHRELVLTGVNIGTYEHEGRGFLDVVEMLCALDGIERVRISSIEPTTIGDELLERMASSDVLCPHLHLPLQSGSDSVLTRMRRKYGIGDFMSYV